MSNDGGYTVLVVDDDDDIRDSLREVLEKRRHHVVVAHNGVDALTCLRCVQVDVIILDLAMPKMDGWRFLDHRQADPRLASIPVIVVTAHRDGHPERDPRVAEVVWKPFSSAAVLAALRRRGQHSAGRSATVDQAKP